MANATSEVVQICNLLQFLGVHVPVAKLYCDNQAALCIAASPVFHEHTKHIEVDCHFIRERLMSGALTTCCTPSTEQTADIFTKALAQRQFQYLLGKLGIANLHAPT